MSLKHDGKKKDLSMSDISSLKSQSRVKTTWHDAAKHRSISSEFSLWVPQFYKIISGLMRRYYDVEYDDLVQLMAESIVPQGLSKGAVLEVGSGTGLVASAVARNAADGIIVHGVDITDGMVKTANENAERFGLDHKLSFSRAGAENLPFESNSFDAVYCSLCFHHFKKRGMKEMIRVTKPGGKITILDLGALDLWRNTLRGWSTFNILTRLRYFSKKATRDDGWARYYTRTEWMRLIVKNHLEFLSVLSNT